MALTEEQMAINRLLTGNTAHSCKADYIKLAIKSLEKQVAKKPIIYQDGFVCCSVCSNYLVTLNNTKKSNYCDKCGQKLDWSE